MKSLRTLLAVAMLVAAIAQANEDTILKGVTKEVAKVSWAETLKNTASSAKKSISNAFSTSYNFAKDNRVVNFLYDWTIGTEFYKNHSTAVKVTGGLVVAGIAAFAIYKYIQSRKEAKNTFNVAPRKTARTTTQPTTKAAEKTVKAIMEKMKSTRSA